MMNRYIHQKDGGSVTLQSSTLKNVAYTNQIGGYNLDIPSLQTFGVKNHLLVKFDSVQISMVALIPFSRVTKSICLMLSPVGGCNILGTTNEEEFQDAKNFVDAFLPYFLRPVAGFSLDKYMIERDKKREKKRLNKIAEKEQKLIDRKNSHLEAHEELFYIVWRANNKYVNLTHDEVERLVNVDEGIIAIAKKKSKCKKQSKVNTAPARNNKRKNKLIYYKKYPTKHCVKLQTKSRAKNPKKRVIVIPNYLVTT